MLNQDFVTISVNPKNREYYISKGYTVPRCTYRNKNANKLVVKVTDLPDHSHIKVDCICKCGKKQLKSYRHAHKLCKSCSNKARAGDSHYSFIHGNHNYSVYKYSAKKRGYDFNIGVDYFEAVTSKPCHYCGDTINIGVDRKDNSKGYVEGNCLPCCAVCNIAKRDLDYDVFLQHCLKIVKNCSL